MPRGPVKHGGTLNGVNTPEYTAWCSMLAWGIERALTTPVNEKFRNGNAGKRRNPGA